MAGGLNPEKMIQLIFGILFAFQQSQTLFAEALDYKHSAQNIVMPAFKKK